EADERGAARHDAGRDGHTRLHHVPADGQVLEAAAAPDGVAGWVRVRRLTRFDRGGPGCHGFLLPAPRARVCPRPAHATLCSTTRSIGRSHAMAAFASAPGASGRTVHASRR